MIVFFAYFEFEWPSTGGNNQDTAPLAALSKYFDI